MTEDEMDTVQAHFTEMHQKVLDMFGGEFNQLRNIALVEVTAAIFAAHMSEVPWPEKRATMKAQALECFSESIDEGMSALSAVGMVERLQ